MREPVPVPTNILRLRLRSAQNDRPYVCCRGDGVTKATPYKKLSKRFVGNETQGDGFLVLTNEYQFSTGAVGES